MPCELNKYSRIKGLRKFKNKKNIVLLINTFKLLIKNFEIFKNPQKPYQ